MSRPSKKQQENDVRLFNAAHPPGTPVKFWPTVRGWGEPHRSTTRTVAQMLQGHTAVVWVEGRGDCIALTHIDVMSDKERSEWTRNPTPTNGDEEQ